MARHRKVMRGAKDRRMFNVTARKTKSINLSQKPMRGGIRLKKKGKNDHKLDKEADFKEAMTILLKDNYQKTELETAMIS